MKKFVERSRSSSAVLLLTGAVFAMMLALNVLTPYICDDFTYRLNFQTGKPLDSLWDIIPSMYAHSYKMNGRLISHGLAQFFMLLPPIVFDLVNSAVFAGTVYLIHRLCTGGRNGLLLVAVFCLFWLCTPAFGQVILWQVGALNYFWSLAALVLFLTPDLLLFREDREILKTWLHRAGFCIYGFFFGWYSEISSFVGICAVFCLVVLDIWTNRRKLRWHRFLPAVTAIAGYLVMLSMPAQIANKQAGDMTLRLLMSRFVSCSAMLVLHLWPLVLLFAALFAIGIRSKLPGKTLLISGLFALAGVCANYMPLAASYYPERCTCTTVLMLIMACGFLTAPLLDRSDRRICGACLVLFALTIPAGFIGTLDIADCHRQHIQREQTIADALKSGEYNVTANTVHPNTAWSGYDGVRDLMSDPETWPNHSMALYYGLDSLTGE